MRAGEALEEQAATDAGYTAAPPIPGRADRAGSWLTELALERPVLVSTDQASRVGELLDEAGRPTTPVAELRAAPVAGEVGAGPRLAERGGSRTSRAGCSC